MLMKARSIVRLLIILACTVLGWEPVIGLEEGLERTIDWMQQHLGGYRPDIYAT